MSTKKTKTRRRQDERAPDEQASDERASDERAPGEQASDERAPGERAPDEQAPDEQAPGEQASNERAPGEQASDERAPGEQASDERAPDEQAPDEQAPDEQAPIKAERKERVLHTRVPESLDSVIKGKAGSLGLSVSNLVRNILQNAFDMVDDIVQDSQAIARRSRGETKDNHGKAAHILGWQELVLNLNAICDRCNAILPAGSPAFLSVLDGPGQRHFRCHRCVGELRDRHANQS